MTDAKKDKLHAWGSDPISNDQLNVTLKLVAVQMHIHHVFHHIAFSPADCGMSTVEADGRSNSGPLPDRLATFALQMTFLLGIQAIFGQEPPIHRRSTTAVR